MWNAGFDYSEQVGAEAAGETLLEYLSRRYRHSTTREWEERIERGQVLVDGARSSRGARLRRGQRLAWRRPSWEERGPEACFALLYQDDQLLGVAKPSGLASVPGGGFLCLTLLEAVRRHFPEAAPLHRLGRGTSGVVLFGRSAPGRAALSAAWHSAAFTKTYRALVAGSPPWDRHVIRTPIGVVEHPLLGQVHAAAADGRPAASQVTVLERRSECSLVRVDIQTGRPHQIRIHLAAAGHPLQGDPLYPAGGVPPPDSRALPGDPGYWLHAERLQFPHPVDGRSTVVECLPPPVLRLAGECGG